MGAIKERMMTPATTKMNDESGFSIVSPVENPTLEDAAKLFSLANERPSDEYHWIAAWNGHEFELVSALLTARSGRSEHYIFGQANKGDDALESEMIIHYPIDPRMTVKDIAGARIPEHNEDGTAWIFKHCDPDFHIDHEFKLQAAVTTAFERQMHALHKTLRTSVYSALLSSTSASRDAYGAASRAYDALGNFREDVKAAVLKEARGRHLGFYHQNPNLAHIHDPVERAIINTAADWSQTKAATLWTPIQSAVAAVLAAVQVEHPYETRWDQLVNNPRRGVDPVGGYEYCYTAVVRSHVIEGHDNLPDPNWDFDHLRNGQEIRGNYTYLDGEPVRNAFLFIAIRFRRPIPDGTKPGDDIGRVEWEQDPAYFIPIAA